MTPRSDRRTLPPPPATMPEPPVAVPAVLPQILLEAVDTETLIATINNDKLSATPIRRSDIAQALTELIAPLGSPTRVEVRELDGSIHADILTPPASRSPFGPPVDAPATVTPPSLWEFTANGFVPGEDVALALVIRHISADPTGAARALLDRGEMPVRPPRSRSDAGLCDGEHRRNPFGMLLHGIMSTIAEFYSRNLATEVVKGMTQKAMTGSTPSKAPLGYLNTLERDELGREVRSVALDQERAPLVKWAFEAYASGNYSLAKLSAALGQGARLRAHPAKTFQVDPAVFCAPDVAESLLQRRRHHHRRLERGASD